MRRRPIKLSKLAFQYSAKKKSGVLNLLRNRTFVELDDKVTVPNESPDILWSASKHFLDYLLVVPMGPGMDACLTNAIVDHNFTLELDLRQPHRQFKAKYGKIGFPPEGRLLYIG